MYCKNTNEAVKRKVLAVVMVGYRNASVLVSRRGLLDRGKTTHLGMVRMIDLVLGRTSGQESERLISAIIAAGRDPKPQHFYKLSHGSDRSIRDAEMGRIVSAVRSPGQSTRPRLRVG